MAGDTEHKDAELSGEIILFHVSKKAAGTKMPSSDEHATLKFDTKFNPIPLSKVIHAELALWSELVLWRKSAPAQRPPEDFKFSRWFQFLPHHFFSLY